MNNPFIAIILIISFIASWALFWAFYTLWTLIAVEAFGLVSLTYWQSAGFVVLLGISETSST